jgi:dCTP diphosphatase
MQDTTTTLQSLKEKVAIFVAERDWTKYHTPKDLSMNMVREASELMEKFLWMDSAESHSEVRSNRQEIENELADVFFSVLCFAQRADIDLARAFNHKLDEIAQKYPVDKAKGKREKYTKL